MKSGIDNAYLAPIWILKVDRVLYEEKYHLKVYFFANVEGLDIEQLRFKFKYEDKEVELKADKFVKAESYPQDPVFGCVLHLPEDYPDCDYDLLFTGLFTGRRYEDYTDYERGQLFSMYIFRVRRSSSYSGICRVIGNTHGLERPFGNVRVGIIIY